MGGECAIHGIGAYQLAPTKSKMAENLHANSTEESQTVCWLFTPKAHSRSHRHGDQVLTTIKFEIKEIPSPYLKRFILRYSTMNKFSYISVSLRECTFYFTKQTLEVIITPRKCCRAIEWVSKEAKQLRDW